MCLWSLIMCVCVYRDLLGGHVMVIHSVFVCMQGLAGQSCDGHSQCACMYTGVIHNVCVVIHKVCVYMQGLAGRSCDGLLLQASGSGFELVQR